jgi:hypothetical protein
MAKKRKLTALQSRQRKEKEKAERRLYEQGKIEPGRPKRTKARKQEQDLRRQLSQQHFMQHKHNLEKLKKRVGNKIDAIFICGTDFGTQISTFCSADTFRSLYMPYYKKFVMGEK